MCGALGALQMELHVAINLCVKLVKERLKTFHMVKVGGFPSKIDELIQ